MARGDLLDRVERFDLCAGCGLCQGVFGRERIELGLDPRGYLRPLRRGALSRSEQELFAAFCPGLDVRHPAGAAGADPVWGALSSVCTAAAGDPEIRRLGSSGGVLSALQLYLLESGQVDYLVATAVAQDDPVGTRISICRSREELLRGAGSRYAPSAPLASLGELLEAPGRFAFVGKPCDVAALRRLGQRDPRVAAKVPFLLSFMCAGVPSREGSHEVIRRLGAEPDQVAQFRYRGDGWPGLTTMRLKDGSCRSMSYLESWGEILGRYVQWRCKLCPDGTGEFADLACADAWHLAADGTPDFSEHEGRSFALARTPRGEELLERALAAGAVLRLEEASAADLEAVQLHQSYRRRTMLARYLALALVFRGFPRFNLDRLWAASRLVGARSLATSFGGTLLRALRSAR